MSEAKKTNASELPEGRKQWSQGLIGEADPRFVPTEVEEILTRLNESLLRAQATGMFFKAKVRIHTKDLKRILLKDIRDYIGQAVLCGWELSEYFKERDVEAADVDPRPKV